MTQQLTEIVAGSGISRGLLQALQNDSETEAANFEDVIHALEEVEALRSPAPDRAALMLRRFVATLPYLDGVALDRNALCAERFDVIEKIADAFDSVNYDANWAVLAHLLRPFLDDFNLDIFTLNYDLLADVAVEGLSRESGKKWFNGYRTVIRGIDAKFAPNEFATWNQEFGPRFLTLSHLHGSLRFKYAVGEPFAHSRRFVLDEGDDLAEIRESRGWAKRIALEHPEEHFDGVSPIVSGLRKLQKINVQPYADYYAYFARAVSESPNLLVIGYGKGDEHITYWLQEYALIHGNAARTVEITDSRDVENFLVNQIRGPFFDDLHWEPDPLYNYVYASRAGIENLAITCGLSRDLPPLPVQELALSLFRS